MITVISSIIDGTEEPSRDRAMENAAGSNGELKTKLSFEVYGASKSAVAAIEKAGGSVKILAVADASQA